MNRAASQQLSYGTVLWMKNLPRDLAWGALSLYHRGGQVEDAVDALNRRPDGSRVEEVHLEQPEPRVRAIQSLQVLRFALVLCKNNPFKQSKS